MNKKPTLLDLFLMSALGLFCELVMIRWVSSELRMFSFYKNFALIGAFLGFGLGFAISQRKSALGWVKALPWIWLGSVVTIFFLGRTSISEFVLANQANAQEFIWAGSVTNPTVILIFNIVFYALLFVVFLLITAVFIPVGSLTAAKFQGFPPLRAYTVNVSGSLFGILFYTLISFMRWPPFTWFLLCAVGFSYFLLHTYQKRQHRAAVGVFFLAIGVTLVPMPGVEKTYWSPYYRIDLKTLYASAEPDLEIGYELSVNQAWHQRMLNLDSGFVAQHYNADREHFDIYTAGYDVPLTAAQNLETILIVGAGAGNDVAGALRAGAEDITAVEIDPVILDIGRSLHPEAPYNSSPNVELIVQDARAFFRRDQKKYDLIIFGRLDSHTLFSAASSVRLDNFVYTVESITDVRNRLKDDGMLILSFGVPPENEWLAQRLYRVLSDVFGHAPQVYQLPESVMTFIIGPEPYTRQLLDDPRLIYREDFSYDDSIAVSTDEWPFLYLRQPSIPNVYIIGLIGVVVSGIWITRKLIPDFQNFSPYFFFMGTAFFLLETKSVTEIALLMGSTWVVNAAVIASILFMIVLANLMVEKFAIQNISIFYAGLGLMLLFNYFIPVNRFLGLPIAGRVILSSLLLAAPMFFAGVIFAVTFKKTRHIGGALGSNLIGAVLGGVLEYSALAFGIQWLYILAMVFYGLSALVLFGQFRAPT